MINQTFKLRVLLNIHGGSVEAFTRELDHAYGHNLHKFLYLCSDHPPVVVDAIPIPIKAPTGTVEFRDDIDLIEQVIW